MGQRVGRNWNQDYWSNGLKGITSEMNSIECRDQRYNSNAAVSRSCSRYHRCVVWEHTLDCSLKSVVLCCVMFGVCQKLAGNKNASNVVDVLLLLLLLSLMGWVATTTSFASTDVTFWNPHSP